MKPTWRPGSWLIILPPMLYLLVFFLIPFAFALKISFADAALRVPPFTDISIHQSRSAHPARAEPRQLPVSVHR